MFFVVLYFLEIYFQVTVFTTICQMIVMLVALACMLEVLYLIIYFMHLRFTETVIIKLRICGWR